MRTKTLLLSAVALFAAGVVSTQAQQVYSKNVVGYANVVTPGGGTYLLAVPFVIGQSNGANEIWPSGTLPNFSTILIWDPNILDYYTYLSKNSSPSGWADANLVNTPAPILPVGQGFFLIPSDDTTNTFSGTILPNVGTTNATLLGGGGTYLVSSAVPYAGPVTNGSATYVGGPNLSGAGGLPNFSTLLIWDPNISDYATYNSKNSSPSGWSDANLANLPVPPSVSVGQAYFLIPSDDFNWQVGL